MLCRRGVRILRLVRFGTNAGVLTRRRAVQFLAMPQELLHRRIASFGNNVIESIILLALTTITYGYIMMGEL